MGFCILMEGELSGVYVLDLIILLNAIISTVFDALFSEKREVEN